MQPCGADAAGAQGGGEPDAGGEDEAAEDEADPLGAAEPGADAGAPGGARQACAFAGCGETSGQLARPRKPWMCKRHRNKMYKDKYKRKKSGQAPGGAGGAGGVKLEESADNILSIVKQRSGSFGDRPARPTLLEQVLNQKRLSLLRSPEVVQFLQKQQQLLNQQVLEQRQQQFPGTSV